MPQMAPMSWTMIYSYFFILFIMILILNYFILIFNPQSKSLNKKKLLIHWK
uniref:ATP synthase F0 subunit 8 n=1 Tax=Curculionoidea sp. 15 KM-2017 TaxID=2219398 RepID=A0A346RG44_9CUCU|nr:ATP synthase F0 subunit 8 [Curculionoidea sp. 15 KM-2017]